MKLSEYVGSCPASTDYTEPHTPTRSLPLLPTMSTAKPTRRITLPADVIYRIMHYAHRSDWPSLIAVSKRTKADLELIHRSRLFETHNELITKISIVCSSSGTSFRAPKNWTAPFKFKRSL